MSEQTQARPMWSVHIDPELKRQINIKAAELDKTLKEVNAEALSDWLKKQEVIKAS